MKNTFQLFSSRYYTVSQLVKTLSGSNEFPAVGGESFVRRLSVQKVPDSRKNWKYSAKAIGHSTVRRNFQCACTRKVFASGDERRKKLLPRTREYREKRRSITGGKTFVTGHRYKRLLGCRFTGRPWRREKKNNFWSETKTNLVYRMLEKRCRPTSQ